MVKVQGKNSAKNGSLPCSRQYIQNARLSKSCQNTCHKGGFMVVTQKVVNIDDPGDCGTVVGKDQAPYVIVGCQRTVHCPLGTKKLFPTRRQLLGYQSDSFWPEVCSKGC